LRPSGSANKSLGEQDERESTEEDFGEAMQVLPPILAKDVARNSEQAVTLRYQLYLLSSFLAMFSSFPHLRFAEEQIY
jgi:hypothetical protein